MNAKQQDTPLISVIIPVYNRPELLKATIKSVIEQTYSNWEIVVVDDGSETEILPVIEKLGDQRISYHKLEHTNANVARNFGITQSKGDYIAMLDADDLWMENHLKDCLERLFESNTDGLYGSLMIRYKKDDIRTEMVREINPEESMIDYLLCVKWGAQTSTLFMTADSAKKIRWNPELNRHQDYDFVVRYGKRYKLAAKLTPTVIYTYNQSAQIDFHSCIRFIKENEDDINPQVYNDYHLDMFSRAKQQNAPTKILKHYQKEATRNKEYLSYYNYIIIKYPTSRIEKIRYKLEYLFHIFRTSIE